MSCFYILSPLHKEVYGLFHRLSHQFALESHHNQSSNEHEGHHIHGENHNHSHTNEFQISHEVEEKREHYQKRHLETHSHELLALFKSVFNLEDSASDEKKHLIELKLDKHILPNKAIDKEKITRISENVIWFYKLNMMTHKMDIFTPPPELSHAMA